MSGIASLDVENGDELGFNAAAISSVEPFTFGSETASSGTSGPLNSGDDSTSTTSTSAKTIPPAVTRSSSETSSTSQSDDSSTTSSSGSAGKSGKATQTTTSGATDSGDSALSGSTSEASSSTSGESTRDASSSLSSSSSTSTTVSAKSKGTPEPTSTSITSTTSARSSASITPSPSTMAVVTSTIPPPTTTSTYSAAATSEPRGCHPGTRCAWQVGVSVALGSVFLVALILVFGRNYRRFLAASQKAYRDHRRGRGGVGGIDEGETSDIDLGIMSKDGLDSRTPPPEYQRSDELFLPDDVQRVIHRVNQMQQQPVRKPVNAYGSVLRKPLAPYRDF